MAVFIIWVLQEMSVYHANYPNNESKYLPIWELSGTCHTSNNDRTSVEGAITHSAIPPCSSITTRDQVWGQGSGVQSSPRRCQSNWQLSCLWSTETTANHEVTLQVVQLVHGIYDSNYPRRFVSCGTNGMFSSIHLLDVVVLYQCWEM